MKIVIAGAKGAGKSTVGAELSKLLGIEAVETDALVEERYKDEYNSEKSCRDIYVSEGEDFFRKLEGKVARDTGGMDWKLIITGGSILLEPANRLALRDNAIIVYLYTRPDIAWERATAGGRPPWLEGKDGEEKFQKELAYRNEVIRPYADLVLDSSGNEPVKLAEEIRGLLSRELSVRCTAANSFGDVIRVTTFGESHGPAIGAVLDGVRPGVEVDLGSIQSQLDRRKPGQSEVTTPRSEKDQVEILSGVFDGKTTGAPIAMVIFNRDHDSSKYEAIKDLFRPGHADFTYYKKYGIRDHRGGGRSSGRETAGRVMCGAVALELLKKEGVDIFAHAVEIGGIKAGKFDHNVIEKNPVRCADSEAAERMVEAILQAKDDENSLGGIVQLEVTGLPAGLGDPVFAKLDARLAYAIMTLGAVKAVEVGRGFELCRMCGSEANDEMGDGGFLTNNAGGISGGISTGQKVVMRVGVKPTASLSRGQQTVDTDMRDAYVETHGRHDPCIVPRVIPVIENMAALVILDAWEIQRRLRGDV
jgi:chorismate synthase